MSLLLYHFEKHGERDKYEEREYDATEDGSEANLKLSFFRCND